MIWHKRVSASVDQQCGFNACTGPRATFPRGPSWAVRSLCPGSAVLKVTFAALGKQESPAGAFRGSSLGLWTLVCGRETKGGWDDPWEEAAHCNVSLGSGEAWRLRVWSGLTGQKTREEGPQRKKCCCGWPGRPT